MNRNSRKYFTLDYHPFGMMMKEQSKSHEHYRLGFQGQEKDNEIKGSVNSIIYKYRIHDPRLGRFLSIDPLFKTYPWYSPYQFSGNRVIDMVEFEGLEPARAGNNDGERVNAPYKGEGDNNGEQYEWTWFEETGEWFAGCLKDAVVNPESGRRFYGSIAVEGSQNYKKPGDAVVQEGMSRTNYWKDLPDGYNSNSGYYYTQSDLRLRLKYQQMGGEVWRWIKLGENEGNAIPISSESCEAYYGSLMTTMLLAEATVPSSAGLAAGAQAVSISSPKGWSGTFRGGASRMNGSSKFGEGSNSASSYVKFGQDGNQIYHTFRKTDKVGLSRSSVKKVVLENISNNSAKIGTGKTYEGHVEVSNIKLMFHAHKLESGIINVGRIDVK